jgi:hypothetical protein
LKTRPQARGLLFSLYAVDGREDNLYQPQTAKSLLQPKTDTHATRKCVCKPSWRSSFCQPAVQYGCQSSGQCDENNFCIPENDHCVGRGGVYCRRTDGTLANPLILEPLASPWL